MVRGCGYILSRSKIIDGMQTYLRSYANISLKCSHDIECNRLVIFSKFPKKETRLLINVYIRFSLYKDLERNSAPLAQS